MIATDPTTPARGHALIPRAVFGAWLICGSLDLTAAFVDAWLSFGKGPMWLLQTVAGALLGPATYEGGLATALLGGVMHFFVALTWTAIFYALSRRFPLLLKHAVPAGLVYGAVVFFAMYRGVLPLTLQLKSLYLTTFNHALPKLRWSQFAVHLVCVGLAIALSLRRFSPPGETKPTA